jgi:hypothetical protein
MKRAFAVRTGASRPVRTLSALRLAVRTRLRRCEETRKNSGESLLLIFLTVSAANVLTASRAAASVLTGGAAAVLTGERV